MFDLALVVEMKPICPMCGGIGRTAYRSPFSPQVCENNHYFKNIEGNSGKKPIYAIVDEDDNNQTLIPVEVSRGHPQ